LRLFIRIFIGWPLSGVVYFNNFRIYIITRFVHCKTLAYFHESILVFIFVVFFTQWLNSSGHLFFPNYQIIKNSTVTYDKRAVKKIVKKIMRN
jgi:hypothetical protein